MTRQKQETPGLPAASRGIPSALLSQTVVTMKTHRKHIHLFLKTCPGPPASHLLVRAAAELPGEVVFALHPWPPRGSLEHKQLTCCPPEMQPGPHTSCPHLPPPPPLPCPAPRALSPVTGHVSPRAPRQAFPGSRVSNSPRPRSSTPSLGSEPCQDLKLSCSVIDLLSDDQGCC